MTRSIAQDVGLAVCLALWLLAGCSSSDDGTEASVVPDTTLILSTTVTTTKTTTAETLSTVPSLLAVPVLDLGQCTGVVPSPTDDGLRDLADALHRMCDATNSLADAVSRSPSFDVGWKSQPDIQAATSGLVDAGDHLEAVVGGIRSKYGSVPGPTVEFLDELEWTLSGGELTLKYLPALLDTQSGEMVEEFWNLGHVGLPAFLDRKIAQFEVMLDEDPTLEGWFHPCFGLEVTFNGPERGWIVTSPTLEFLVDGTATPDGVVVGSEALPITRRNYWWESSTTLRFREGVNEVPVTVTCNDGETLSVTVPITYLPDAQARLADVVSATGDSITLDWVQWDDSAEFPGPVDDDPGITETLPVSEQPVVWLGYRSGQRDFDYEWLVDRIESGEPTDDHQWAPGYPYWVTISDGVVIQLEMVQLG